MLGYKASSHKRHGRLPARWFMVCHFAKSCANNESKSCTAFNHFQSAVKNTVKRFRESREIWVILCEKKRFYNGYNYKGFTTSVDLCQWTVSQGIMKCKLRLHRARRMPCINTINTFRTASENNEHHALRAKEEKHHPDRNQQHIQKPKSGLGLHW